MKLITMSDQRKAVIKNADMEEKMQQDAVDIASKALSEYNIEKVDKEDCKGHGVDPRVHSEKLGLRRKMSHNLGG